jgi:hypothetical protein
MDPMRSGVARQPIVGRAIVVGACVLAVLGGVVGLILGLRANAGTAWFAVLEVAAPGAMLGAVFGAAVGVTRLVVRRSGNRRRQPSGRLGS